MTAPILIWGAGAIGGTLGAAFIRAGHSVVFVDSEAAHVAAINDKGLRIDGSIFGNLAFVALLAVTARASAAPKHCDIYRDDAGILHTRGGDELTAFACFGYLHGRERAWQLDYLRRAAQGRLAEALGSGSVK